MRRNKAKKVVVRNSLARLPIMGKGGPHVVTNKQKRKNAKSELMKKLTLS